MCIISMWYTRVSVCPIRFLCFGWRSIPFLRAIHSTFSDISYLSERQRADEEKSRCVFTYHLGCCFCFCLLLLRSSFSSFAIPSYWIIFSSMTSAGLWLKKASSIFKSPPSNSRLESESWIRMIFFLPLNSTFPYWRILYFEFSRQK